MEFEIVDDPWAGTLSEAMLKFQVDYGKSPWPAGDVKKIETVVDELGLRGCRFACNSNYVFDVDENNIWKRNQGILHIHKTMLVATKPFSGSIDRGLDPYPTHPHFYGFSDFRDKSSSQKSQDMGNKVWCPKTFQMVPIGFECVCGEIHYKD